MIKTTKEQKEAALADEIKDIQKWVNPKAKVRKVSKIEEDGSKTIARVLVPSSSILKTFLALVLGFTHFLIL